MPDDLLEHQQVMSDDVQRLRALDVSASFLVQAPAGSGKTELLIQRFLALLATVDRPEAILAMTFTRKAAGEMRERIIEALRDAAAGGPVDGAHAATTRTLAAAVLARDAMQGWHLLEHSARLRVMTIDALATGLARSAPLTTRTGAAPAFLDHAESIYRAAASDALVQAAPDDPSWRVLLEHLDNDGERLVDLLARLLPKRDQWLRHIVGVDADALRTALERTLSEEIEARLAAARALFPAHVLPRMAALARYALGHLTGESADEQLRHALQSCQEAGGVPGATCTELADWAALASWLLIAPCPQWRKKFTIDAGFPPKRHRGAKLFERDARKIEMTGLLGDLARVPGLGEALHEVRQLPPPHYTAGAWQVIEALLTVLPRVAAALKVQFAAQRAIDFSEASELALLALGTPDMPSDVLLAVDQSIEHLLLDEFQDTSLIQRDLISRLTAGWMDGDGRTLFVVGDPMQSIYRFREAEVSLFLAAQREQRWGEVTLEPMTLSRNFRSRAGIVDWVNRVFPGVLPEMDDPVRGAVRFKPSVPSRARGTAEPVTADVVSSRRAEAVRIVQRVQDALAAEPHDDVAILVRARSHLVSIIPALRAAGIAFHAVDLERLTERAAIRDLLALTHALLQPADRLAWLAVLRAPWCGLSLADLLVVASASRSVLPAILDVERLQGLSADGCGRIRRLAPIIGEVLQHRQRRALDLALRGTWLALGGPATLTEASDLDAAERYFGLLAEHARAGDLPDWAGFVAAVETLFAAPDPAAPARVQVMTLHKAKGLQFGTVILAGLAAKPRKNAKDLLVWRAREKGLMLALLRQRAEEQEDPVYAYLRRLEADEEDMETGRLLYVGTTRAKHRLHLTACLATKRDPDQLIVWKDPPPGSLLSKLFVALSPLPPPEDPAASEASVRQSSPLRRLPLTWCAPRPKDALQPVGAIRVPADAVIAFDWARETARQVGVAAHRFLARIAATGLHAWPLQRVRALRPAIRATLLAANIVEPELKTASALVEQVLTRTLTDARGRWLFDPTHVDTRSEWALAGIDGDALVHVTLDWTFVCGFERWIVDFKTGTHEGGDLDGFLAREQERYAPQLERYARLVRELDPRPIRLALYYPLQGGWREWRFEG